MSFTCFVCLKKFETVENTILHLKKLHQLRDNAQDFKCLANPLVCNKTVRTFATIKKHSLLCSKSNTTSDLEKEVNIKIIQLINMFHHC